MRVETTLICPEAQGRLTRISASPDGRSCLYRSGQDEEITLALTSLNGQSASDVLAPTERRLKQLLPAEAAAASPASVDSDSDGDDDHDQDDDHEKAHVDAPFVHVDADHGDGHDRAKVDAPFVHVDADGNKAHVKVFGVTIDADDNRANVETDWGSKTATIKAGPMGSEIRTANLRHGSLDLVYILAGDQSGADGWRTVGYLAQGPSAGPLLVATFKSRTPHEPRFHDPDLDDLMRLNVHG